MLLGLPTVSLTHACDPEEQKGGGRERYAENWYRYPSEDSTGCAIDLTSLIERSVRPCRADYHYHECLHDQGSEEQRPQVCKKLSDKRSRTAPPFVAPVYAVTAASPPESPCRGRRQSSLPGRPARCTARARNTGKHDYSLPPTLTNPVAVLGEGKEATQSPREQPARPEASRTVSAVLDCLLR